MNFQMPRQDDDFDYYGNSSDDESRGGNFVFFRNYGFVIPLNLIENACWINFFRMY